jgi:hypothetical protein
VCYTLLKKSFISFNINFCRRERERERDRERERESMRQRGTENKRCLVDIQNQNIKTEHCE